MEIEVVDDELSQLRGFRCADEAVPDYYLLLALVEVANLEALAIRDRGVTVAVWGFYVEADGVCAFFLPSCETYDSIGFARAMRRVFDVVCGSLTIFVHPHSEHGERLARFMGFREVGVRDAALGIKRYRRDPANERL